MREHWNSDFRVRLHTNAADPEVRSETRETIAMAEYVGHTSLQIKNYEHSSCAKPVQQGWIQGCAFIAEVLYCLESIRVRDACVRGCDTH